MKLILLGVCLLLTGLFAGCSSNVALMRDDIGGYRQERLIYACEDQQLCGSSRLYDVNWLSCFDYPVDYRAKIDSYTPSRTQYIYQQRSAVVHP
jgi:hypothetical protein